MRQYYENQQLNQTFKSRSSVHIVLVVGDSGVGKTTAIRKFIKRPFPTRVVPTVAFEFYSGSIQLLGKQVKLNFWDMSGKKSKNSLALSYLNEADAVVVFYDLTQFETFHSASHWIDTINQKRELPIFLFGNKLDLCFQNEGRQVMGEQVDLAKKIKGVSKIGSGLVDSSFQKGLLELVKKHLITNIIMEEQQDIKRCCCT